MTTTTPLGSISRYLGGGFATLRDSVTGYLVEEDAEEDYNVDALVHAYRDAINDGLKGTGITLVGDELYGEVSQDKDGASGVPAAADEDVHPVASALASVDLDALCRELELADC